MSPPPQSISHEVGNILDESYFHKALWKTLPRSPDDRR